MTTKAKNATKAMSTTEPETPDGPGFRTLLRPDEFAADCPREWLAEGVILADSPVVMACGRMELTWFAADLAVSLAAGTPFLGHFPVPWPRRTAFCCYQTPFADLRAVVHAVAAARGADLGASELRLSRQGPPFRTPAERQAVVAEMRAEGIEVVVLDTIQQALRTGERNDTDSEAARLSALGDAFLAAGVTPVFAHGTSRWLTNTPCFAELTNLGLCEYARQWILFGRVGPVTEPASGDFRLAAGGFAGHDGKWNVRARTGQLRSDFGGLTWDVAVTGGPAPSRGTRGSTMMAADDDVKRIYAEAEAETVENRGKRLTGRGKSGR